MPASILEGYADFPFAMRAADFSRLLFGYRDTDSSDFRHEFWRWIDVSDWYAIHAVTSFLNFIYPSSQSRLTAVGIETPNIPQKTLNVALS